MWQRVQGTKGDARCRQIGDSPKEEDCMEENSIIASAASTRRKPWLGVGVSGHWTDYREALEAAGMDFTVHAYDAKVELMDDPDLEVVRYERVPDVQVNVRVDDNKIMGCVSDRYSIIQNHEAFALLEPFTQAGGVIEHAGYTEQGLMFMVLHIRNESMLGDDFSFDVMCCNSFNGAFPLSLKMVPTRIICQNMYRKLMGGNSDALLKVRHSSLAKPRLAAASSATGNVLGYIAAFDHTLQFANTKQLSKIGVEEILLPKLFPYPKEGGEREATFRAKVDALREDFMDRYYDAEDNRKYHEKALGFINAYYDYLSHHDPTKNMPGSWDDRRLSGLVSGTDVKSNLIKQVL